MDLDTDRALRERIMRVLGVRIEANAGLSRAELEQFPLGDGEVVRLLDKNRGIRNPAGLNATLSVLSTLDGPYDDDETDGGLLHYAYRKGSIEGDNRKLRRAWELQLPIILIRKIEDGVFVPYFPVWVIYDDRKRRRFTFAFDEFTTIEEVVNRSPSERRYRERVVRQRLHQRDFRARIVHAYDTTCAICGLTNGYLLDGAHIVGDREDLGDPITPNGICLCKNHHSAYDWDLLGIAPDLTVHISPRLRTGNEGNPMINSAFLAYEGTRIAQPKHRADHADPDRLKIHFERFCSAH